MGHSSVSSAFRASVRRNDPLLREGVFVVLLLALNGFMPRFIEVVWHFMQGASLLYLQASR